jgi:hypothetical protein
VYVAAAGYSPARSVNMTGHNGAVAAPSAAAVALPHLKSQCARREGYQGGVPYVTESYDARQAGRAAVPPEATRNNCN